MTQTLHTVTMTQTLHIVTMTQTLALPGKRNHFVDVIDPVQTADVGHEYAVLALRLTLTLTLI